MVRLLIIEPGYCPYIANFDNIESAVREVIPGTSQLTLPFDTAKIGMLCSENQSGLKFNRQINEDFSVYGRCIICGVRKNAATAPMPTSANANKNKFVEETIKVESQDYISDLNNAINEDRIAHGKKPLKFEKDRSVTPEDDDDENYFDDNNENSGTPNKDEKKVKTSTTDPDSGFMHRDGKPQGFFYLDHRTVDSKYNIITDTFVTPGNVNDVKPYIERLKYQIDKWGFPVKAVGLDAGYNTSAICKQIYDLGIEPAMGKRRGCQQKGKFGKYKYTYLPEWDIYICPEHNYLQYTTTNRQGYKEYKCKNDRCASCPRREMCLSAKQTTKSIRRHVWEDFKDKAWKFTHTDYGKKIYARRKETIERSFADSKELHGGSIPHFV